MNIKNGNLKIYKIDKDNKKVVLGSVKFELYSKEDGLVGTYTTDENGEIEIDDLRIGEYTIKEISTNKWYNLVDDVDVEIKWNETADVVIENELKKGQAKIIKVDSENSDIKLENVEFEVLDENGKCLEKIKTNSKGEAFTSKYVLRDNPSIYLKEIATNDKYLLNSEMIKVDLSENEVKEIVIENTKIKGQIKIIKTSKDDNFVTGLKAGSPIEGVKFQIYNNENIIVDTITTDKKGEAITSKLEKGKYKVKEIETDKWYYINNNIFNVEIKENNEVVNLKVTNESKNPDIYLEKIGQDRVEVGKETQYDISIKNAGNTLLNNFTWVDEIPTEYITVTKFQTGTYNQNLKYNLYYKTNLSLDKKVLLMEDLNTFENYEIDFSEELADNEYVTEIELDFGTVDVGFCSNENPKLNAITKKDLKSETTFVNTAYLNGEYQGFKMNKKSSFKTLVYKLLPKTGF